MNENEPLSMSDLAEAIHFRGGDKRGRSLLRELEAREKAIGVRFVTRLEGPERTNYRCTVAALRMHCPDLLKKDDLRRALSAHLEETLERTKELVADEVARQFERRRA